MRAPNDAPFRIAASKLSEQTRRTADGGATLDLRSHCPVCGNPYQPGEGVLALACLSFATDAGSPAPAATGHDPGSRALLGHPRCVLPRLLTLLACFQPEGRFVTAFKNFSACDTGSR
jgi:hypothetical protein